MAGSKQSPGRERCEVELGKSKKVAPFLAFLTKQWETCFLMFFTCRTLKILVSCVTSDTKTKTTSRYPVKGFNIQYLILSVPLLGQKYENGGFTGSSKNNYQQVCMLYWMHAYFWNIGIEDWFARTPLMPKHSVWMFGEKTEAVFEMPCQQVLSLTPGSSRRSLGFLLLLERRALLELPFSGKQVKIVFLQYVTEI